MTKFKLRFWNTTLGFSWAFCFKLEPALDLVLLQWTADFGGWLSKIKIHFWPFLMLLVMLLSFMLFILLLFVLLLLQNQTKFRISNSRGKNMNAAGNKNEAGSFKVFEKS